MFVCLSVSWFNCNNQRIRVWIRSANRAPVDSTVLNTLSWTTSTWRACEFIRLKIISIIHCWLLCWACGVSFEQLCRTVRNRAELRGTVQNTNSHVLCGHPHFLISINCCTRQMHYRDSYRNVMEQHTIHGNDSVFTWEGIRRNTTYSKHRTVDEILFTSMMLCVDVSVTYVLLHTRRSLSLALRSVQYVSVHVGTYKTYPLNVNFKHNVRTFARHSSLHISEAISNNQKASLRQIKSF